MDRLKITANNHAKTAMCG